MIAFDTNILMYCCDQDRPEKHAIAQELIRETHDAVLPWQVAVEFVAATRRLERRGFTRAMAWSWLDYFTRLFKLVAPGTQILGVARKLHLEQQWSYWDALIVAACQDAGVTRLYSEDLPGRTPPEGLEIVNPFA
jgi:predicted nucleic acid-binding protein